MSYETYLYINHLIGKMNKEENESPSHYMIRLMHNCCRLRKVIRSNLFFL